MMTALFVGDDWAKDHHDIEIQAGDGTVLKHERVDENPAGFTRFLDLISQACPSMSDRDQVYVGVERGDGPWVNALLAADFTVYAINPLSASRYHERHNVSGTKSDPIDAASLAGIVREDRQFHHLAGMSSTATAGMKILVRTQIKLTRERTRTINRLKGTLVQYFPTAETAYDQLGLDSDDVLDLLIMAPTPDAAAALTDDQLRQVLTAHHRRIIDTWISRIRAGLDQPVLPQPAPIVNALAVTTVAYAQLLKTITAQITALEAEIDTVFSVHPDAEVYLSFPGVGVVTGARMMAEFGDNLDRFVNAIGFKNYSGLGPVTRASGKVRRVRRRRVRNRYLSNACRDMAAHSINPHGSPGCRAYYNELRSRGIKHESALRRVGHRLVGCLYACLRDRTLYNETKAWPKYATTTEQPIADAA